MSSRDEGEIAKNTGKDEPSKPPVKAGTSGKKRKGGKRRKSKKKIKIPPPLPPTRDFYVQTMTDLNKTLAILRTQQQIVEDKYFNLKENMGELGKDRSEVGAHATRKIVAKDNVIKVLEERLTKLIDERDNSNTEAIEKINEIHALFKDKMEQLKVELKLVTCKFNTLDELNTIRNDMFMKFEDQEAGQKERRFTHKKVAFVMDQAAVIKNDARKKQIEAKKAQLTEEFDTYGEIRNSVLTRRLISENIALYKQIGDLVEEQRKKERLVEEEIERGRDISEKYEMSTCIKKQLDSATENKAKIIMKLTENYNQLRKKHEDANDYCKLYKVSKRRDFWARIGYDDMVKQLNNLSQRIEELKIEKKNLSIQVQRDDQEIDGLREIIEYIRAIVQTAIEDISTSTNMKQSFISESSVNMSKMEQEIKLQNAAALRELRRKQLINALMEVICNDLDKPPHTASQDKEAHPEVSIYRVGALGFIPLAAAHSVDESSKRAIPKATLEDSNSEQFQFEVLENSVESSSEASFIAAELGSNLYATSSLEGEDAESMDCSSSSRISDICSKPNSLEDIQRYNVNDKHANRETYTTNSLQISQSRSARNEKQQKN